MEEMPRFLTAIPGGLPPREIAWAIRYTFPANEPVCAMCGGAGWRRAEGEEFIGLQRCECVKARAARRGQSAMPCVCQPVLTCYGIAQAPFVGEHAGSSLVAEAAAQYKPRHPERTASYRLFEDHFDRYVRSYEERFEPRSGPLRPVVVRSVEEFLSCGRLQGGFARIRCPKCRAGHLLAFH